MEISEHTLVEVVRSQGAMEQAFTDMSKRLDQALPYLNSKDEALDKRVRKVEKKTAWIIGIGTALSFLLGLMGIHIRLK